MPVIVINILCLSLLLSLVTMTCMVLFPGKTKAKLVEKQFKKIRKYRKFPIFTHHLRTFCETLVRMFVSVAYISVRMFLRKYVSETGPRILISTSVD